MCAVLAIVGAGRASAQSASLYGDPHARQTVSVADSSWTYEPPTEPRQFKVNDQLTVLVSEKSQLSSEGKMDRRKNASGGMKLTNWILLDGFGIFPDPQTRGDPTVSGEMANQYRSQATLTSKDALTFKIAVRIVEKRPNGLLVVEGHRSIQTNNEIWEQCLTGVVRPEDVLQNNTVLSENVGELRLFKREEGHVRDGYRRGWFLKLLDKYQLF
jgi:flagellar L-ring protein precursor FlgH